MLINTYLRFILTCPSIKKLIQRGSTSGELLSRVEDKEQLEMLKLIPTEEIDSALEVFEVPSFRFIEVVNSNNETIADLVVDSEGVFHCYKEFSGIGSMDVYVVAYHLVDGDQMTSSIARMVARDVVEEGHCITFSTGGCESIDSALLELELRAIEGGFSGWNCPPTLGL